MGRRKEILKEIREGNNISTYLNDEDPLVRAAIATLGYELGKLINDSHYVVRTAVAEQGYGLTKLKNDPSWYVRYAVARNGVDLSDDKEEIIRLVTQAVKLENDIYNYIFENGCPSQFASCGKFDKGIAMVFIKENRIPNGTEDLCNMVVALDNLENKISKLYSNKELEEQEILKREKANDLNAMNIQF